MVTGGYSRMVREGVAVEGLVAAVDVGVDVTVEIGIYVQGRDPRDPA
jgi:hypothetical protein